MQALCPSCSNKIVIDDARVPDRAFSVKCPKCQNTVKFPGKGQGAAAAVPAAPAPATPPAAEPSGGGGYNTDEMRAQMMAQLRREMTLGGGEGAHSGERALVALPDRGLAGNIALMLTRLGYAVETLDDWEEGARLLEQGVYNVVVTAPAAGAGGKESLYQKALRINPEARRRLFIVLIADNLKTGDGTQAFVLQGDLVVSSREAANADVIFRNTLSERTRIYSVYLEAKKRADAAAGY
jgi:predicted Zn finger-like uncharacterized protein